MCVWYETDPIRTSCFKPGHTLPSHRLSLSLSLLYYHLSLSHTHRLFVALVLRVFNYDALSLSLSYWHKNSLTSVQKQMHMYSYSMSVFSWFDGSRCGISDLTERIHGTAHTSFALNHIPHQFPHYSLWPKPPNTITFTVSSLTLFRSLSSFVEQKEQATIIDIWTHA